MRMGLWVESLSVTSAQHPGAQCINILNDESDMLIPRTVTFELALDGIRYLIDRDVRDVRAEMDPPVGATPRIVTDPEVGHGRTEEANCRVNISHGDVRVLNEASHYTVLVVCGISQYNDQPESRELVSRTSPDFGWLIFFLKGMKATTANPAIGTISIHQTFVVTTTPCCTDRLSPQGLVEPGSLVWVGWQIYQS